MSTDDTRPLPAPDDETPTRAIEPVAADETESETESGSGSGSEAGTGTGTGTPEPASIAAEEPLEVTRPLPTAPLPEAELAALAPEAVPAPAPAPAPAREPAPAPAPTLARTPAPTPAPPPSAPAGPELRVGTVVWGLVVAVVGIGIVSFAWGARIDGGLALIVLLAGAGVALLVGSLVVAARRPHRHGGRG